MCPSLELLTILSPVIWAQQGPRQPSSDPFQLALVYGSTNITLLQENIEQCLSSCEKGF